ncbi:hypothetical protein Vretimale_6776 [Volvox reticuliferus]|uniref:Uncharacterized protein n=1 Tax=Volvox reticuliferus TaxID=1737510 RepID=A0A8J4G8J7_9CHLO|nr:hypothetical protein Vretifemale_7158 [Volvox reticuliferus]GIM02034.1 hypothetical protein Vretimale_6776 [Volvox reticuliferus]
MRHARSGSSLHGMVGYTNGPQRNPQRQGQTAHRAHFQLDSPPRTKQHRGGPSMSAERFLLIVEELQARANELWELEQIELQRGNELMVICCSPSLNSPQHDPASLQAEDGLSSPVYHFDQSSLLQAHSHILHSPSLIPGTHAFQSPTWSNDFSAIAASLILPGPHVTDTAEEPCGLNTAGQNVHHGAGQQPPMAWQHLGAIYDIEAHVTFPQGLPCGGSGGTSATARSAKARLLERFDGSGGAGTATARHAQNVDPFCCSLTPVSDDFLGSPSWACLPMTHSVDKF